MIPILRALVLMLFAVFAVILACRKEECQSTYRLILMFVAVGATTFIPEDALLLQAVLAVLVFLMLTLLTNVTVARIRENEKNKADTRNKRNV